MKAQHQLPPPIWVDTAAGFRGMVAYLREQPALAIDTESNSLYAYYEQVCLIQVSVPGFDYLVDPLSVPDLSELAPLLADADILKVLHGAEYDLRVLDRDFGFTLANLFDTMWASRILGWPSHGLAAILQEQFGVELNKKYQRANWGVRPLPSEQLDYARLDSHFLLALCERQTQELKDEGHWQQAQHRFSKLTQTRWEPKPFDPEGFWQLAGVRELDDRGRGILRALYLFREEQARAENRPRFKVLGNKALVGLSEQRPSRLENLHQVKGISHRIARKYGHRLLAAIRQGAKQPLAWDDRPRPHNQRRNGLPGRPSPACQARFEALRAWRNATAEKRGVEPDIILANQLLWAIAHRNPRSSRELGQGDLLARWQVEEFGEDLLRILRQEA